MGYQESWLYIEPQRKFEKLIRAYEKAEQSGYYEVAGAKPRSVIVLKQPFGDIPAGKKLLWVCGDRGFHCAAGVFGGELKCSGRLRVIPVEEVLDGTDDPRMEGLDFDSPAPSENAYMKRYSVANYAHRMRAGLARYFLKWRIVYNEIVGKKAGKRTVRMPDTSADAKRAGKPHERITHDAARSSSFLFFGAYRLPLSCC